MLSGAAIALVSAFRMPDHYRWREILMSRMLIGGWLLMIGGLVLQAIPL